MTVQEPALYAEPWREFAACAASDVDPAIFFPEKGDRLQEQRRKVAAAKAVCAGCPVRLDCLQFAIDSHEQWGIFGGMTPSERRPSRMASTILCRFCGERFPKMENVRYCSVACRQAARAAQDRSRTLLRATEPSR